MTMTKPAQDSLDNGRSPQNGATFRPAAAPTPTGTRRRFGTGPGSRSVAAPLPWPVIVASWVMLAISFLAAWLLVFTFVISGLQQHRNNSVLYSQFREQLSEATAPIGGLISEGTPVALLSLPQGGLHSLVVVEGTSSSDLAKGPGHRRDSALPGQAGTSLIYGRSLSYGGPFSDIAKLKQGSKITVTTGQGIFTYSVRDIRHPGDPLPPRLASGKSRLTLETASGTSLVASNVVYVDAEMNGTPVPSPSGRARSVPTDEKAMQGDHGSLPALVFWLQLLVIVCGICVWIWQRWGRAQAWLIGAPMLLAALWLSTQSAFILLPNLL